MRSMTARQTATALTRATIWDFADELLIRCPDCAQHAVVKAPRDKTAARLTCAHCGRAHLVRTIATLRAGPRAEDDALDPYFALPLWLQVPCAGHVLWAYNARHLAFLREYVSAKDRQTPRPAPTAPRNRLLASRLPRWMKLGKNRGLVLRGIARLERMLATAGS
jgi:hypothetical protein